MALFTYDYSISNDTPNGKVALSSLEASIRLSAITAVLNGSSTKGDELCVYFDTELSVGDEATLDGIVASTSGDPLDASDEDADSEATTPLIAPGSLDKLSVTTAAVDQGRYLIRWYAEYRLTVATNDVATASVLVEGVEVGRSSNGGNANWCSFAGHVIQTFSLASKNTIVIRLALAGTGGAGAEVRRARLLVTPVD